MISDGRLHHVAFVVKSFCARVKKFALKGVREPLPVGGRNIFLPGRARESSNRVGTTQGGELPQDGIVLPGEIQNGWNATSGGGYDRYGNYGYAPNACCPGRR